MACEIRRLQVLADHVQPQIVVGHLPVAVVMLVKTAGRQSKLRSLARDTAAPDKGFAIYRLCHRGRGHLGDHNLARGPLAPAKACAPDAGLQGVNKAGIVRQVRRVGSIAVKIRGLGQNAGVKNRNSGLVQNAIARSILLFGHVPTEGCKRLNLEDYIAPVDGVVFVGRKPFGHKRDVIGYDIQHLVCGLAVPSAGGHGHNAHQDFGLALDAGREGDADGRMAELIRIDRNDVAKTFRKSLVTRRYGRIRSRSHGHGDAAFALPKAFTFNDRRGKVRAFLKRIGAKGMRLWHGPENAPGDCAAIAVRVNGHGRHKLFGRIGQLAVQNKGELGKAAFPGFHLAQGFIAGNKHFVLHSRGNGHACGLGQADEDRAAAPPDVRAVYGRGLVHGAAVEGEREFRLRAKICDRAFAGRIGHHIPEVIRLNQHCAGGHANEC